MTVWDTIQRGEYVMFALAVLFIVSILILWIRCALIRKQNKSYNSLMQRIRDHVVEGDIDNALQLCEMTGTPGADIVGAGLRQVGNSMSEVRASMKEEMKLEKIKLQKGVIWLRLIGIIAPLIGAGGTLVGIIDRLRDLGAAGSEVTPASICAALAPTIVTTVAGLVVGICALIALACLTSSITGAKKRIEALTIEFINLLNEPS